MKRIKHRCFYLISIILMSFVLITNASAQSTGTIQGTITDQNGAAIANARVIVRSSEKNIERVTQTAITGNYQIASLPTGTYQIDVQAQGFSTQKATDLILEVSKIAVQNFQLRIGEVAQEVNITAESQLIESATTTVGQVINQKTVQEIPLNGRHFVDLGLLIPGSVTPPQSGFLTAPTRGQGAFAFNTAGAREDTVNFMINGINLNDMVQNQITFQPSINTVQEFKADNSTYSAEYGRNSGAIVNIATRSGTNRYHGEVFNFLRNDVFDARNFFDSAKKPPFKRNQFGSALGGPLYLPVIGGKDKTFFFFSYEGLRQRQGLTLNNGVLSDAQRAGITDPIIKRLVTDFVPRANAFDVLSGRSLFVGSATAPVNIDQWTIDISRNLGSNDLLHVYYAIQRDRRGEPTLQLNTIPGFGDTRVSRRQIYTLNETHTFGPRTVSETRFGFNRIRITFTPNNLINPVDYGIQNGVNEPIGLPQIAVTGLGLNFGGPAGFPQGRADTIAVVSNSISHQQGRHSFKFGGEFRKFFNNNFNKDTGAFVFPSANEFIKGNSNNFNITLGERNRSFGTGALGVFIQDGFKVKTNLNFEFGVRYDWNQTPSERFDRMVVFDSSTVSLIQLGSGRDLIYKQNNKNFQPRLGIIWDPFKNGKTSIRAAYGILVDQPVTNMLAGPGANPPLARPLNFGGVIKLNNAPTSSSAAISPTTIDPNFDNAYVQSWNLNIQREITPSLGMQIGYFGSKGTHLRISRNINQGSSSVKPFLRLSAASPILPNQAVRNITEITSAGNSSYNALWASVNKRLSQGLQFNASYTWSKSIDYNSLNSQGVVVQDSFNLRNNRGLSDFDARHRFVISALYELPFKGNRLVEGWQISTITQLQSGNPVNIVTNIQPITGVLNTGRPNLNGEIQITGKPEKWFTNNVCDLAITKVCAPGSIFVLTGGFGNLGRNVVTGPDFKNVDFSIMKKTKLTESLKMEFRTEIFDLFNHANFGQPGGLAAVFTDEFGVVRTSPVFGVIQSTRFPTGDSGSSRQLQFALKLVF